MVQRGDHRVGALGGLEPACGQLVTEPAIGNTRRSVNVSIDGWSDAPLDAAARWEDLEGSA